MFRTDGDGSDRDHTSTARSVVPNGSYQMESLSRRWDETRGSRPRDRTPVRGEEPLVALARVFRATNGHNLATVGEGRREGFRGDWLAGSGSWPRRRARSCAPCSAGSRRGGHSSDAPNPHLPVARRRPVGADRQHLVQPGGAHEGLLRGVGAGAAGRRVDAVRLGRRRHRQRRGSKAFSERRQPLFHPRDSPGSATAKPSSIPYDGRRSLDTRRGHPKPDFLPRERPLLARPRAGEL